MTERPIVTVGRLYNDWRVWCHCCGEVTWHQTRLAAVSAKQIHRCKETA